MIARAAFTAAGFEEVDFTAADDFLFGVGTNRLVAAPAPFVADVEMFAFVGYDALADRCFECGFVYDLTRASIVDRLETDASTFVARIGALDDTALHARPRPDVWSPLEYACHVRDMLGVQSERVDLIACEEAPELVPMGRDERVVNDRYNAQDPPVVTGALVDAAHRLSEQLRALDDDGWQRTGMYTYPTRELRTIEWIGNHTVHELQHHAHDITA